MTIGETKSKQEVIDALHGVAAEMHDKMLKGKPPAMTLPVRTKKNIQFDKKLQVYKYGKNKSTRDATALSSARVLLRSLHITEFIEEMIRKLKKGAILSISLPTDPGVLWRIGRLFNKMFSIKNKFNC